MTIAGDKRFFSIQQTAGIYTITLNLKQKTLYLLNSEQNAQELV